MELRLQIRVLWWLIYILTAYEILCLTIFFIFKRSLPICHITQGAFW